MRKKYWENFFGNISKQFTVSLLAKPAREDEKGPYPAIDSAMPVFDAIDLLEKNECLQLTDGRIIKRKFILKRPLRILLFIFLTELESKLYRTQEWSNRPLKELNETNMNDLIRDLINDEKLFSYQTEYKTRGVFKEDLKAISSIRNLIAHVNKKLELETDFGTIIKRKRQMLRLLKALDEILDEQERGRKNGKS